MRYLKSMITILILAVAMTGCSLAPKFSKKDQAILDKDPLPYVKSSPYAESLKKLGDLLPLSPLYDPRKKVVIQVQQVANKTACKQLPLDLTDMLKTAGNRVGGNVLIAPFNPNVLILEAKTGSKITKNDPVLVINGSITECDEKIEEVSTGIDGNVRFGKYKGKTDIKAKQATQKTYSRIALDLHLVDHANNVLLPNKQTSMAVQVWDIKKYRRFGFQVNGSGLGLDGRRKATQEKHNAVRTLVDLSMLQLLGKYFEVPYWTTIKGAKPDSEVLDLMVAGFRRQTPRNQLILVQNLLQYHGFHVTPNAIFDTATKKALEEFAGKRPELTPDINTALYRALAASAPANGQAIDTGRAAVTPAADTDAAKATPLSVDVAFVYVPAGDDRLLPLDNGAALKSGDHYKIIIKPDTDCFLYLFQVDSAGRLYMLFPLDDQGLTTANPVRTDTPYTLPGPEESFILDNQTGSEKIFLLATREKDPVVEQLSRYFTEKTPADIRKKAENKLGVYLFGKQRITDATAGGPISLGQGATVPAKTVRSLNSSRVYEFSFQHQ